MMIEYRGRSNFKANEKVKEVSGRAFSEAVFPALQARERFFLSLDYLLLIPLDLISF